MTVKVAKNHRWFRQAEHVHSHHIAEVIQFALVGEKHQQGFKKNRNDISKSRYDLNWLTLNQETDLISMQHFTTWKNY